MWRYIRSCWCCYCVCQVWNRLHFVIKRLTYLLVLVQLQGPLSLLCSGQLGVKWPDSKVITHLHLLPKLRMQDITTSTPPLMPVWCVCGQLSLYLYILILTSPMDLGLPGSHFLLGFVSKILYALLIAVAHAT